MKKLIYVFLFLFPLSSLAQVSFVENKGQWDSQHLYRAEIPGGYLYVQQDRLIYSRTQRISGTTETDVHGHGMHDTLKIHNTHQVFLGSSFSGNTFELKEQPGYYNYFIGDDPSKWASKVKRFQQITLKNFYPGIHLELIGGGTTGIKYNFIVEPGADPKLILWKYLGNESNSIDQAEILQKTSLGIIKEEKPFAYQTLEKNAATIAVAYQKQRDIFSISLGEYDKTRQLTIDPVLVFSTYTGSYSDNFGFTATYDFDGNAYTGGDVRGANWTLSPGSYQQAFGGGTEDQDDLLGDIARDCAIMKLSPDGKTMLYSTFLGGSWNEQPHSLVVDQNGNLVILGTTFSTDFPKAGNGFDQSYGGNSDVFVAKLSQDGSQLLGMTYIGGQGRDGLNGRRNADWSNTTILAYNFGDDFRGEVIVDRDNNILVASCTESSTAAGFPAQNGFNNTIGGKQDGFIAKLNPNLSNLIWCSYSGGLNDETMYSLDIDLNGNVFVCGGTSSPTLGLGFSGLNNQYLGGSADGYVLKISPDGSQVLGGSYIGTNAYDQCHFVKLDKYNNVYLHGQTSGSMSAFPNNVYHKAQGGQFIFKLSNDLNSLLIRSLYGEGIEKPQISPTAFMIDSCERIFVSGWGGLTNNIGGHGGNTLDMETTSDAFQPNTDGSDFYIAVFSKNMGKLAYGTFIGGSRNPGQTTTLAEHVDGGTSRFDPKGIIYQSVCGGCGGTNTADFPTTPGAHSRTNNSSNCNNAIFKLDFENLNLAPKVQDTTITVIAGEYINLNYTGKDADDFDTLYLSMTGPILDDPSLGFTLANTDADVAKGFSTVGMNFTWQTNCDHVSPDTFYVSTHIRDFGCPDIEMDSAQIKIVVLPPPTPAAPEVVCMTFLGDDRLRLTWDGSDTSGYLKRYFIIRRVEQGPWSVMDSINPGEIAEFTDDGAIANSTTNYCYAVVGINDCGMYGDTSYYICSVDQSNSPISAGEIFNTTVVDNKYVQTTWFQSQEPDFKGYYLYRKFNNGSGKYELVERMDNREDTVYLDDNVDVQNFSYCYELAVRDRCGNSSIRSNPGCSILLRGITEPYEHTLSWSPYTEWQNGVDYYELWRRDDRPNDSVIYMESTGDRQKLDSSLDYDWGAYNYYVLAYENGGNEATSRSNYVRLIQPPLLHVPTAFTRNGDGLNEVWGITDVFVKDYRLLVYNRWGQKVLETTDKNFQWDGYFRNEDPFDNVYIWYVVYTGWDDSKHTQKGTLTILR